MSDPGVSYRSKEEIQHIRKTNDPINNLKQIILDNNFSTENELKEMENNIKHQVLDALEIVLKSNHPKDSYFKKYIYCNEETKIKTSDINDEY